MSLGEVAALLGYSTQFNFTAFENDHQSPITRLHREYR